MGSIIVRHKSTPTLVKYASDGEVSDEEIMTNGLMAAIPWGIYDLNKNNNRHITVVENQYISLTAGDSIKSISAKNSKTSVGVIALDNSWTPIGGASYKLAGNEDFVPLPDVSVGGIS
jgi:hypothetical protein